MPASLTSDPWLLASIVLLGVLVLASLIRWALSKKHRESLPQHLQAHSDLVSPLWHRPAAKHQNPLARYKAIRGLQTLCLILLIIGLALLAHEEYLFATGAKLSAIPDPAILILIFFSLLKYIDTSHKLKELGPTK